MDTEKTKTRRNKEDVPVRTAQEVIADPTLIVDEDGYLVTTSGATPIFNENVRGKGVAVLTLDALKGLLK